MAKPYAQQKADRRERRAPLSAEYLALQEKLRVEREQRELRVKADAEERLSKNKRMSAAQKRRELARIANEKITAATLAESGSESDQGDEQVSA